MRFLAMRMSHAPIKSIRHTGTLALSVFEQGPAGGLQRPHGNIIDAEGAQDTSPVVLIFFQAGVPERDCGACKVVLLRNA